MKVRALRAQMGATNPRAHFGRQLCLTMTRKKPLRTAQMQARTVSAIVSNTLRDVRRSVGNGEVESSILSRSTIHLLVFTEDKSPDTFLTDHLTREKWAQSGRALLFGLLPLPSRDRNGATNMSDTKAIFGGLLIVGLLVWVGIKNLDTIRIWLASVGIA